jgi:hypothetical protein
MLTAHFFASLALHVARDVPEGGYVVAVGSGEAGWDEAPPAADRTVAALVNETARKAVGAGHVVFLDRDGEPTDTPTTHLRFSVTFEAGEGTGALRECGLLRGATERPGSGRLLSYHVHPRIEKGDGMTLRRTLRIDLSPRPFVPGNQATRWLGNTRSGEVHDLDALTPNCQVDEIRSDRRHFFVSLDEASGLGYDPCAYCLGRESPPDRPTRDDRA